MAAAAHTPGGYGGVPQSVGKEFNKADTGKHIIHALRTRKPSTGGTTQGTGLANAGSNSGAGSASAG
jgi:hypothetical protein